MKKLLGVLTLAITMTVMTAATASAYYKSCMLYVVVHSSGEMRCGEGCDIYSDDGKWITRRIRFVEC